MAELHELLKQKKVEDYREWLKQDFTTNLVNYLIKQLEEIKDDWAHGKFTHSSTEGTVSLNGTALGEIAAVGKLLQYIVEGDMLDEEESK